MLGHMHTYRGTHAVVSTHTHAHIHTHSYTHTYKHTRPKGALADV